MTYFRNSLVIIFALVAVSGCSTWSADKCQSTNWDTMGYSEASTGKDNASGLYASRCQKKGVSINSGAYNKGYSRGLMTYCNYNKGHKTAFSGELKEPMCSPVPTYNKGYSKGTFEYCTAATGYKVAVDGGAEAKICSGKAATNFMKGYKKGRRKFVVEEINNLKEDLAKAKRDLDDIRDRLSDKQNQLARVPQRSYEPSVIRLRQDLQNEVGNLSGSRDEIKQQVDEMSDRLGQLERESRDN